MTAQSLTEAEQRALFAATLRDALRQHIAAEKQGRDGTQDLDRALATARKLADAGKLTFFQ